jgi:hypothetical protein
LCFGSSAPYSAYDSGDFFRWDELFSKWEQANLAGQPDPLTAEEHAELGNLENSVKRDAGAGMETRERRRQYEVKGGRQNIDKAYTQYGDDYYNDYKQDYTDYYFPQLEQQFGDATGKLTATLAGRGMKNSTVGIDAVGDLTQENIRARTAIGNEAQDATQKLRGTVENSKTNLYALNESAADAAGINARAIGEATALVAPPAYSPLGQVFAAALQPWANYSAARQNRPRSPYSSVISGASGQGSGRVIT